MSNRSWTATDAMDESSAIRAATARSLGGPYLDALQVGSAYRAASNWLQGDAPGHIRGARIEPTEISGSCERGIDVLCTAVELVRTVDPHVATDVMDLVFLGCRTDWSPSIERSIVNVLQRGGVVVASDRSVGSSLLGGFLLTGEPAAPRRARVALGVDSCPLQAFPFYPAVRLLAGHMPLTSGASRVEGSIVLASDVLTGDILALLVPVMSGFVLYSTAHWLQNEPADLSGTGRRPLFSVPAYAAVGRQFPFVTVGEFHAAAAMLSILTAGLRLAFRTRQMNGVSTRNVATELGNEGCNGATTP